MLTRTVKSGLEKIAGPANVSFSREDLLCYSYDATGASHMPDAVVFPGGAGEISLILKMANAEGFPVTPRGAGSGFTGGSLPVGGGVVLSTERMTALVEIDTANFTAVVEPGVITGDLQKEVEKVQLFYPPDPTSKGFSTIGGNIAECAGGPRALKYGVTRDYVLGLEVVLPTGEIVNTGTRTAKGVVGYDMTRLLVGSEGTLGVVTKATLRLIPLPQSKKTLVALFPRLEDAASAVAGIIASKVLPSTLELIDAASLRCVEDYTGTVFSNAAGAMLLIEADGIEEATEREAEIIKKVCAENRATEVRSARDGKEVDELWKVRRALSPSLSRLKPTKLNEDVVVPRSKLVELVRGVEEIAKKRGVIIASFGHAGDGNIHVNVMIDKSDPVEAEAGERAVEDIFELTVGLGGTISGEHGVGVTKAPYLGMELTPELIDVMRRIKDTLDPNGILNPGKIFNSISTAGRREEV
ncbi:MAG: FAD-linked oxidase C-terminal domain-containing protein [Thermodesulfobacteriota bacterium]